MSSLADVEVEEQSMRSYISKQHWKTVHVLVRRHLVYPLVAIQIQRFVRGFLARCQYRRDRKRVLLLQCIGRAYMRRYKFQRTVLCREHVSPSMRDTTATRIQRALRGALARRTSSFRRTTLTVVLDAIAQIQRWYRGCTVRRKIRPILNERRWAAQEAAVEQFLASQAEAMMIKELESLGLAPVSAIQPMTPIRMVPRNGTTHIGSSVTGFSMSRSPDRSTGSVLSKSPSHSPSRAQRRDLHLRQPNYYLSPLPVWLRHAKEQEQSIDLHATPTKKRQQWVGSVILSGSPAKAASGLRSL